MSASARRRSPTPRRLGLIIMGRNPLAVDLVGARLLGFNLEDVPYLKKAVERGYLPARLKDVKLMGDLTSIAGLDSQAQRVQPYDDEFYRWHDVEKELKRLKSPLRFYWGHSSQTGPGALPAASWGSRCISPLPSGMPAQKPSRGESRRSWSSAGLRKR